MNFAGSASHYPFDNAAPQAGDRFAGLSALYDGVTCRHLDRLGVGTGWWCLEIGAGGGSVARFLSERVGPAGRVVATDINIDWLAGSLPANVEVRRHDVGVDPLPEATFDLIHCRAVLTFVPQRHAAVRRMVAALKPGGRLLIEEMVPPITEDWSGAEDPDLALTGKARHAIVEIIRRDGGDLGFSQQLPRHLRDARLTEVGAEGFFVPYRSEAVALIAKANIDEIGAAVVAAGLMSADELRRYRAVLDRPDCWYPVSMALISAWGRRPL